jgi:outer membrane protein
MNMDIKIKKQFSRIVVAILTSFITFLFYTPCYSEDFPKVITISDGLKIATEKSRIVKIAAYNKDISRADTLVAKSRFFPLIEITANDTFLRYQPGIVFGSTSAFTGEKESLSYGINVYQTIYDFGGRTSQYDASRLTFDSANLDIERIKNIVALDFITAYFDLLETEKMILIAQKEVERFESHLKIAQSFYEEGVITKNDLLQAEVKLSDAKQQLITTKNLRALHMARINNILSLPLTNQIQVIDISRDTLYDFELITAWENALEQRLELKIIDNQIKINDLEERAKKSEYFPSLYAQGGYNYTENRYLLYEDNWSLIVGISFNLFSGGSTKAKVSQLQYRKSQLLEQREKLLEDIKLEVEKSYLEMKNADEKIQVTKDAISQAEENLRINKIKYEEGVGTATDVIDAITLLTKAETNFYTALYEFSRAQAGLIYSMGLDLISAYR